MLIDQAMVKRVAALANLSLTEAEVDYFQKHLSRIVAYVAELSDVPLPDDSVSLSSSPTPAEGRSLGERPDALQASLDPRLALVNAAESSGSAFKVPRIID